MFVPSAPSPSPAEFAATINSNWQLTSPDDWDIYDVNHRLHEDPEVESFVSYAITPKTVVFNHSVDFHSFPAECMVARQPISIPLNKSFTGTNEAVTRVGHVDGIHLDSEKCESLIDLPRGRVSAMSSLLSRARAWHLEVQLRLHEAVDDYDDARMIERDERDLPDTSLAAIPIYLQAECRGIDISPHVIATKTDYESYLFIPESDRLYLLNVAAMENLTVYGDEADAGKGEDCFLARFGGIIQFFHLYIASVSLRDYIQNERLGVKYLRETLVKLSGGLSCHTSRRISRYA